MIHSLAWVAWLVSALILVSSTRNPLYLVLLLLALAIVSVSSRPPARPDGGADSDTRPAGPALLPLVGFLVLAAGLFNLFTSRVGATVLLRIPGQVPYLSGPLTLEALVYGGINGLALSGVLLAFLIFNRMMPVRALVRLIPQAFAPVALIVSIALTFLPTLMKRGVEIREAQAIRGHQVRGLRDWGPLFYPLLVDSLERAFQLAEAMTARGLACDLPDSDVKNAAVSAASVGVGDRVGDRDRAFRDRITHLGGLVVFCAGWGLRLTAAPIWLADGLCAAGALWIFDRLWRVGRRSQRTVYHPETWTPASWAVTAGCLAALALVGLPGLGTQVQTSLSYTPYPALHLPPFDGFRGLAPFGLVLPAFLLSPGKNHDSI